MDFLCRSLQITERELEEIKSSFKVFDSDRDGHITPGDLSSVLRLLGSDPSKSEVRNMIAELDIDKNGAVDFREFLIAQVKKKMQGQTEDEELQNAFRAIDENGDGFVTAHEIRKAMKALGDPVSREEAEAIIRDADGTGRGRVNFKEFTAAIQRKKNADSEENNCE